jgi:hypothetical protein
VWKDYRNYERQGLKLRLLNKQSTSRLFQVLQCKLGMLRARTELEGLVGLVREILIDMSS